MPVTDFRDCGDPGCDARRCGTTESPSTPARKKGALFPGTKKGQRAVTPSVRFSSKFNAGKCETTWPKNGNVWRLHGYTPSYGGVTMREVDVSLIMLNGLSGVNRNFEQLQSNRRTLWQEHTLGESVKLQLWYFAHFQRIGINKQNTTTRIRTNSTH